MRSVLLALAATAIASAAASQATDAVNASYLTNQRIAIQGVLASAQRVKDATGEHILVLSYGPASDPTGCTQPTSPAAEQAGKRNGSSVTASTAPALTPTPASFPPRLPSPISTATDEWKLPSVTACFAVAASILTPSKSSCATARPSTQSVANRWCAYPVENRLGAGINMTRRCLRPKTPYIDNIWIASGGLFPKIIATSGRPLNATPRRYFLFV